MSGRCRRVTDARRPDHVRAMMVDGRPWRSAGHEPSDQDNGRRGGVRGRPRVGRAGAGPGLDRPRRRRDRGPGRRTAGRGQRAARRPGRADANRRRTRPGTLPEPARRHLHDQGHAPGLHSFHQQQRPGAQRRQHTAHDQAGSRRRSRDRQRDCGHAGGRSQARDDDHQRDARGAREPPARAGSLGRDGDGADGLHGPRQRRRLGIGAAVELQRERRTGDRQHLEPRRRTGHRHGRQRRPAESRHRLLVFLLRLRQLSGDGRHHRRRRRTESDARRAAQHGVEDGHQHAARRRAPVLREPEAAGRQYLARAGGGAGRCERQRQSHRQVR